MFAPKDDGHDGGGHESGGAHALVSCPPGVGETFRLTGEAATLIEYWSGRMACKNVGREDRPKQEHQGYAVEWKQSEDPG